MKTLKDNVYAAQESLSGGKIPSLQVLRGLLCAGVFVGHVLPVWGGFFMSFFLVLSGCLLVCRYHDREIGCSLRECAAFAMKRLSPLYPLHILMMLAMFFLFGAELLAKGLPAEGVRRLLGELVLNVTLLQDWVPIPVVNVSLNGVAWYLSVALFLYFMFPQLLRLIKRFDDKGKLLITCGIFWGLQLLAAALTMADADLNLYLLYFCPVSRLVDFFIGCTLGYYLLNIKMGQVPAFRGTLYELAVLMVVGFGYWWGTGEHSTYLSRLLGNYVSIYSLLAVPVVSVFIISRGWITRGLQNKLFLWLGDISGQFFLVHYVVIRYCQKAADMLGLTLDRQGVVFVGGEFVLALLVAAVCRYWKERHGAEYENKSGGYSAELSPDSAGGGKIASLQALRAMAFLGIFCCHAGVSWAGSWSAWGVSVFLVLSGFLLIRRRPSGEVSLVGSWQFAIARLRKIYGLHILTMLIMAGLLCYTGATRRLVLLLEMITDTLLLKAWVPIIEYTVSLNGPAWYLSVALFCYVMFPFLQQWLAKIRQARSLVLLLAGVIGIQLLAAVAVYYRADLDSFIWFTYCFPLFRLGDFAAGCILGQWYWQRHYAGQRVVLGTMAECVSTVAVVLLLWWLQGEFVMYRARVLSNWTTLYMVAALAAVMMFAAGGGLLTRVMRNRLLLFLGDISGAAFLIHFVLLQGTFAVAGYYGYMPAGLGYWLLVGAVLAATVILSALWQRICDG